jgi:hypothetical protein
MKIIDILFSFSEINLALSLSFCTSFVVSNFGESYQNYKKNYCNSLLFFAVTVLSLPNALSFGLLV